MLDHLSNKKIDELNIKNIKIRYVRKKHDIPEFEELNDLVTSYGSLVNYEAWHSWKILLVIN